MQPPAPALAAAAAIHGASSQAAPFDTPDRPVPAWVVATHILAVALIQSVWMATQFIMPILARKRFGAGEWETVLITATPTIFFSLSIFWNDYFSRRGFGRYMGTYWVLACLPPAFIALANNYWGLLIPHLVACIGGAGFHPAAGGLIRTLYPERTRGRIYSFVWGSSMFFGAGAGLVIGHLMDGNPDAFRVFFPVAATLQLAGVLVFTRLSRVSGNTASRVVLRDDAELSLAQRWRRLTAPVAHMGTILKGDPTFARYEAAYMTYGVGWMICYALLPILVTKKLNLSYDSIAESTHVAYWLAMTAMVVPAGLLMDRIGAARSTGLSFALLTLYPLGLIFAGDAHQLMIVSIVYGCAHAGANVGWMLGPVSLAPSPDKVPQYVAIHATLVGIRGKLFQFAGMGLFTLTHSYALPLALAGGAFLWSAVQMRQLDRRMKAAPAARAARP